MIGKHKWKITGDFACSTQASNHLEITNDGDDDFDPEIELELSFTFLMLKFRDRFSNLKPTQSNFNQQLQANHKVLCNSVLYQQIDCFVFHVMLYVIQFHSVLSMLIHVTSCLFNIIPNALYLRIFLRTPHWTLNGLSIYGHPFLGNTFFSLTKCKVKVWSYNLNVRSYLT